MKISEMTAHDMMERMGSEATVEEARWMLRFLRDLGYETTESVPEKTWLALLISCLDLAGRGLKAEGV